MLPEQAWYGNGDAVDPVPWAAYVLGYHPHALRINQEDFWERFVLRSSPEDDTLSKSVRRTVEELDEALYILAQAECVKSAALVEVHRVLDQLAANFAEIVDEPFPWKLTRLPLWHPSGLIERLFETCRRLLAPESKTATWRELGDELGNTQHQLRLALSDAARFGNEALSHWPERAATLVAMARRLEGENATISFSWPSGKRPKSESDLAACYRVVCRKALELHSGLMHLDPPGYDLVLTPRELIVRGRSLALEALAPDEAAFLSVLAEKPGIRIDRKTIIAEAHLRVSPKDLINTARRVRAAFVGLAKATQGPLDSKRAWISGLAKRGFPFRPFWLEVDAGLVRIDG